MKLAYDRHAMDYGCQSPNVAAQDSATILRKRSAEPIGSVRRMAQWLLRIGSNLEDAGE